MDAVEEVQPDEIVLLKPSEDPVPIQIEREQRRDEPPTGREQLPTQTSDCISEEGRSDPRLWGRRGLSRPYPGLMAWRR